MVQIFQHMADVGSMCLPLISVLTLARKIIFLIVSVVKLLLQNPFVYFGPEKIFS